MVQIEPVLPSQDIVGECPVWSVAEDALYWVDILGRRFHRYHPASGEHEIYTVDVSIGAIALRAAGGLIMATGKGFATYNLTSRTMRVLATPFEEASHMRFNDGSVDCRGRFWAGTVSTLAQWDRLQGKLYRFDPDGLMQIMDTGFALVNGIAWSPDNTRMYVVDSVRKCIFFYDFDPAVGMITNRRVFLDTSLEVGIPDGLTVDVEGMLWVAFWDGWKVVRYDASGKRSSQIDLPVQCPTSCAFGGRSLEQLYITSAWEELNKEQRASQPFAGDLFRIQPATMGLPRPLFLG